VGDLPPLQVTKVWPDKIRYRTDQKGVVSVEVRNTTTSTLLGEVMVELFHDLDSPRLLKTETVKLATGKSREITLPLPNAA
jgi:hypothetical protein